MIELTEQLVPVKVNKDKNERLAKKYKVMGLPTILFVDGKGKTVGKMMGYRPPEAFVEGIEEILRVHRELPDLIVKFEENPSDLETGGLLANTYASRGDTRKAKKYIKAVETLDPKNDQGHLTEAYMALAEAYESDRDFKNAAKSYEKAANSAKILALVANARFATARSHFHDRTRLKRGSRAVMKKLDEARQQLDSLLAMKDVPQDRLQEAKELLQAVTEAGVESEKEWQAAKEQKKSKKGRRR